MALTIVDKPALPSPSTWFRPLPSYASERLPLTLHVPAPSDAVYGIEGIPSEEPTIRQVSRALGLTVACTPARAAHLVSERAVSRHREQRARQGVRLRATASRSQLAATDRPNLEAELDHRRGHMDPAGVAVVDLAMAQLGGGSNPMAGEEVSSRGHHGPKEPGLYPA